jgi:outer membrane protein
LWHFEFEFQVIESLNFQVIRKKEKKVNSRMLALTSSGSLRKTFQCVVIAAACVFGASALRAQSAAPGSASAGKIGVINVRQAIASTAEGKQAGAELQSQFASRQSELEGLNKQINDLRSRIDAGTGKFSQDEQARLQREGETKARQLQRKQDEYQEDVNAAQADVFDRIGRKMIDVLDRYARENGYVAVLDTSAQNTPIIFASTNIDVTQDIVKLYDQAYPVKGGGPVTGTQPKPATQKPAAQPPAAKPPQR